MAAADVAGSASQADDARALSRVIWGLTAATAAIALAAAALAGVRFAHGGEMALTFLSCLGPLLALRGYARWRSLGDDRLPLFLDVVASYTLIAYALVVAQQAAGTRPVPDITAFALRFDAALGFRWFDYVRHVSAVPGLDALLQTCYRNWIAEFVIAMAALAYIGDFRKIGEFTVAYLLTGAASVACLACFDMYSLHSAAAFGLPGFHHPSAAGPETLKALLLLRSGADTTLDFRHIEGFISLPSLHAASALLLAAATRGLGVWRLPFLVFNVAVLVSTISEGGHDLADIAAGIAVALAALKAAPPLFAALAKAAAPGSRLRGEAERFLVDRPLGLER